MSDPVVKSERNTIIDIDFLSTEADVDYSTRRRRSHPLYTILN